LNDDFTMRNVLKFMFNKLFGQSWSAAIRDKDFGVIADWFANLFVAVGFLALVSVAVAAGLSGADGIGRETVLREDQVALDARDAVDHNLIGQTCQKPQPPRTLANSRRVFMLGLPNTNCQSWGLGLRVFSLGLLLAGACTCVGWLFGLIFGVPRASTLPATTASGGGSASQLINTNLMDISDWLTKTIVGVGLTQLMVLPRFLGDLAADMNRYGFQWGDYGHLFGLGILLYFFPGGFWLGYVGTRTLLTKLFDDFLPAAKINLAAASDNLQLDGGNNIRPPKATVSAIDATLLATPLQSLQSERDVIAWASAQARAGHFDIARAGLENVLSGDPNNADVGVQLLKVYLAMQAYTEAIALSKKLPDSTDKMLASLYDYMPEGYTQALATGANLLKDPKMQNNAILHVWLACAYGQQYTYAKSMGQTESLDDIVKKVEAEVATAVSLDPHNRGFLFSLWRPAHDSLDDDLRDIPQDDAVLKRLLEPTPSTFTPPTTG
jgi:hypothetical protein